MYVTTTTTTTYETIHRNMSSKVGAIQARQRHRQGGQRVAQLHEPQQLLSRLVPHLSVFLSFVFSFFLFDFSFGPVFLFFFLFLSFFFSLFLCFFHAFFHMAILMLPGSAHSDRLQPPMLQMILQVCFRASAALLDIHYFQYLLGWKTSREVASRFPTCWHL